ncbi:hypothetical protein [Janthinobacterium lividum]|uniref:hypothetical protein n=1 Tax=Janthinobacterium lividum TaxID=29581 RepID=UPI0009BDE038|nr:hypothetical protein [Janthinobacterium lividum]MCC7714482.1 hypothetical protein [Janthinobacterium lividum]WQE30316.1 hypothetical protein U0004_07810 [Janthinobacterium lividum]
MNIHLACCAMALVLFSPSQAAAKQPVWTGEPRPMRGDYQIYGGMLSEMLPPTRNDRKVAIMVIGELARELFTQIGPDVKQEQACSFSADYRERCRGDIACVHTKGAEYECYFGLDLRTGKGTSGAIC